MPDASIAGPLTAVARHIDEIVVRAARRAKREIPIYEAVPELEIRQGIARDLGTVLALMLDEREATDDERHALSIIGETRAQQGLPLESMLRVYRITLDEVFQAIWTASESGEVAMGEALNLTREVWRNADTAMEMAVAAYRHRELERAASDAERRAALVHALLFSPAGAPAPMIEEAGLDPAARYAAFRARVAPGAARNALLDLQLPGALPGGLAGVHGADVIGFATARPQLSAGTALVLGLGPHGELGDLARSFSVATRIVDTASAFGLGGPLTVADVALEAIARHEELLGDELVARYLEPVDGEVTQTLHALVEAELNTDRAAEALSVHPNTVRKRLRRFETQTGASLQSVDDLLRLRLALLRDRLQR